MAGGKKKKKPVANPARGFATTSLPSKAKQIDAPEQSSDDQDGSTADPAASSLGQSRVLPFRGTVHESEKSKLKASGIEDMTPEQLEQHLENAELQSLLDANSTRCKAEAKRQVTKLEAERRQLRVQAQRLSTVHWLPFELISEILDTYRNGDNHNLATTITNASGLTLFDESRTLNGPLDFVSSRSRTEFA